MELRTEPLPLTKRNPLTISRGTSGATVNLLVRVCHAGIEGIGELAPSGVTGDSAETGQADLEVLRPKLAGIAPWERERIEVVLRSHKSAALGLNGIGGGSGLIAAVEMACWDWLGKKAGLPVWKLLGLDLSRIAPTSVTVGINPPDVAASQAREWQERTGARHLKVKLGAPAGIEADKAMYAAVQEAARPETVLRVDANGGWSLDDAQKMIPWLAERGVEYIEQPLSQGDEESLSALRPAPVPIFLDETVRVAADVPRVLNLCDGVNVKLMKCGGISEATRIVAVARAHGLQTMLGCMGESSLAIAAGAQVSPLFDHLDLDSHQNLINDPFVGLSWKEGRVTPEETTPGLGITEHRL
jgi:L-alanine-DL-glutamate epimerase-like enolase superfamily enzyme